MPRGQETNTYECLEVKRRVHTYTTGDEYIRQETSTYDRRRVHTTGDEYIRQETSTYKCLEVRRRVHTTGDEYIQVPRGQETSAYECLEVRRRVHTSRYKSKELSL